jgi:hypothetical protein
MTPGRGSLAGADDGSSAAARSRENTATLPNSQRDGGWFPIVRRSSGAGSTQSLRTGPAVDLGGRSNGLGVRSVAAFVCGLATFGASMVAPSLDQSHVA